MESETTVDGIDEEVLPAGRPGAPRPTLEIACSACGYGIVVRRQPPACPMCGQRAWEPPLWRPFGGRLFDRA